MDDMLLMLVHSAGEETTRKENGSNNVRIAAGYMHTFLMISIDLSFYTAREPIGLIRVGLFHVVDDQDFDRASCSFELET